MSGQPDVMNDSFMASDARVPAKSRLLGGMS